MKTKNKVVLTGETLTIEEVIAVCRNNDRVVVPDFVIKRIQENWDAIAEMLERGDVMYGLNTGIGGFGNVKISKEKAGELSTRML